LENLGSILREKRKGMGMSLEQVSAELRIKLKYIEALEEERYELLPDRLYKKIFLKAYIDYLGLDFEELWNGFSKKEEEEEVKPLTEIGRTKKKSHTQLLILVGIILGLLSFLVFLKHKKSDTDFYDTFPESKIEETKTDLSAQKFDSEKFENESVGKEEVKEFPSQPEEMTLRLEGLDKTWALVLGDGDTLFSGFINSGMKVECKTQNLFKITLGRAWAVKGYLNGKRLRPFGAQGKSIYGREINRDNYKDFLDTIQEKR